METNSECTQSKAKRIEKEAPTGLIYIFGWIGAVIYYISVATTFWGGVLGVLKSFVWPAFLVYHALKALGA
ncbi:hypothetical protein [Alkalitalea saponilacus]|uniref:Uncharacterized protein n=1 Tax=Alkalitalea saponilacus TaxID=889453 RepID=A0A1T5ESF3_9BACT|nr:hypothetical protein [Alkalitalea saponilacus]ASB48044.1 hypothetical protein CDL62_02230 [Alkalitalea saponilacus]SKB86903.1 hypothetical protein SAMN03080601_01376 [Alkalitalea saponilacus]